MTTMTPQTEGWILEALDDVASRVGAGATPEAAIAEAIKAAGLAPGHVGIVVAAYNTGRTTRQRLEGASPAEKAADFPSATRDGVLGRLYPADAGRPAAPSVSDDYLRPPSPPRAKAAAAELPAPRPWGRVPRDPAAWLRKGAEAARRVLHLEKEAAAAALDDLDGYFRSAGALAPADVQANLAADGRDEELAALDVLAAARPGLAKRAAADPHHSVRAHRRPYDLLKRAVDCGRHAVCAEAAIAAIGAWADALEGPKPRRAEAPAGLLDGLDKAAATSSFRVGVGSSLAAGLLFELGRRVRTQQDRADRYTAELDSPEHDAKLRAIQANAMLQDFLAHDEVIKAHDPHAVAQAFNRISQFAPRVSGQPLMMEALLRQSLEQPPDPFQAEQIGKAEKGLMSTQPHRPPTSGPSGEKKEPDGPEATGLGKAIDLGGQALDFGVDRMRHGLGLGRDKPESPPKPPKP